MEWVPQGTEEFHRALKEVAAAFSTLGYSAGKSSESRSNSVLTVVYSSLASPVLPEHAKSRMQQEKQRAEDGNRPLANSCLTKGHSRVRQESYVEDPTAGKVQQHARKRHRSRGEWEDVTRYSSRMRWR